MSGADLLRAIFPAESAAGSVVLWTLPDKRPRWFSVGDLESLTAEASRLAAQHDVYFTVAAHDQSRALAESGRSAESTRGSIHSAAGIGCLWAEIDCSDGQHKAANLPTRDEARRFLDGLPLYPSAVVSSGGGFHVYWLLREFWKFEDDTERQRAAELARGWVAYLAKRAAWKVDSVGDLARVLRVPGTLNRKRAAVPVEVVSFDESLRYSPSDFAEYALGEPRRAIETAEGHEMANRADASPEAVEAARRAVRGLPPAVSGKHGHDALWRAARVATQGYELSASQAFDVLREDYNPRCLPPWTDADLRHKINDAITKSRVPAGFRSGSDIRVGGGAGEAFTPGSRLTETDLAERFIESFGRDLCYVPEWNDWLVFSEGRWSRDVRGIRVLEMTQRMTREMRGSGDLELAEQGFKAERKQARENIVSLARSIPGVAIGTSALDADPWLLSCRNGVIDLRTGQLRESRRDDYLMKCAGVPFDPEAKAPRWEQFIDEVSSGDPELATYLRRAAGYALTGQTGEQCFFFFYGEGANGKSTLVQALQLTMGDYAATLKTDALMARYGTEHPAELVPLFGARFVTATEVSEGHSWDEARLKALTGGDRIAVRRMHENFWHFDPTHKLFISGNHRPSVRGDDFGMWRRVRLVPFRARFTVDPTFFDKQLAPELPGILAWAVRGCLEWQREGLGLPRAVQDATADYKTAEDVVRTFIAECCKEHPQADATTMDLYDAYREWTRSAGEKTLSKRAFSERLERLGFARSASTMKRGFTGLILAADWKGRIETVRQKRNGLKAVS